MSAIACAVIVFQIVDGGAPVPAFDVVGLDLDDGVEKLQRQIVILGIGRRLGAGHEQIAGVAAGDQPQRPDALLDGFGAGLVGRDLQRREQGVEIVDRVVMFHLREIAAAAAPNRGRRACLVLVPSAETDKRDRPNKRQSDAPELVEREILRPWASILFTSLPATSPKTSQRDVNNAAQLGKVGIPAQKPAGRATSAGPLARNDGRLGRKRLSPAGL